MDKSIERRKSRRFQITLSLLVRWTDGESRYDSGHCVNIGQGGMFVLAAAAPPLGAEVEIEFVLPPFGNVPHATRLQCVGRVSRHEMCCQVRGFAVAGHFVNEMQANSAACLSVCESPDAGV